jgi:hypothetical protein
MTKKCAYPGCGAVLNSHNLGHLCGLHKRVITQNDIAYENKHFVKHKVVDGSWTKVILHPAYLKRTHESIIR